MTFKQLLSKTAALKHSIYPPSRSELMIGQKDTECIALMQLQDAQEWLFSNGKQYRKQTNT